MLWVIVVISRLIVEDSSIPPRSRLLLPGIGALMKSWNLLGNWGKFVLKAKVVLALAAGSRRWSSCQGYPDARSSTRSLQLTDLCKPRALLPFMPQFSADCEPDSPVQLALLGCQFF